MVFAATAAIPESVFTGPGITIVPYPGLMRHEYCFAVAHEQQFQGLFTMRIDGETYRQETIKRSVEIDPVYCFYNEGPHKHTIELKVKSGFHEAARLEARTNPAAQMFATLIGEEGDEEEDDMSITGAQFQNLCFHIDNSSKDVLKFSGLSQYAEGDAAPKNQGKGNATVAPGETKESCFELRGWKKGTYTVTGEIVDAAGKSVEKLSYTIKPRTMERAPTAPPTLEAEERI